MPVDVAIKVMTRSENMFAGYDKICREAMKEAGHMESARRSVDCKNNIVKLHGVVQGPLPSDIIALFKLRSGDEAIGLVMQYEAGGSLSNFLHNPGVRIPISTKDAIVFLRQIALCLTELHAIDIVHGDLKPENILLSSLDISIARVVISDFGLAKKKESYSQSQMTTGKTTLEKTSRLTGTPIYCATEMHINPADSTCHEVSRPTRKTDVYAFAVICWEVLVREKPFADLSDQSQLSFKLWRGERPALSKIPNDCPGEVVNMIEKCWMNDRSQRLQAVECLAILDKTCSVLFADHYDIFLSHPWKFKPVLCHVQRFLTAGGYKTWYDQVDMGNNITQSVIDGIARSKVVVVCLNSHYQTRVNCMIELKEARRQKKNSYGSPIGIRSCTSIRSFISFLASENVLG